MRYPLSSPKDYSSLYVLAIFEQQEVKNSMLVSEDSTSDGVHYIKRARYYVVVTTGVLKDVIEGAVHTINSISIDRAVA